MTCALLDLRRGVGQELVRAPSRVRRRGGDDGLREEGMYEPDPATLELDHALRHCWREQCPGVLAESAADELERGERGAGCEEQRLTGGGRELGQPRSEELVHVLGEREALVGLDDPAGLNCSGKLEGEERVAAGHVVDAPQRGTRHGQVEPFPQHPMQSAEAERPDRDDRQALFERTVEAERRAVRPVEAPRDGQRDRGVAEAAPGELEQRTRRLVEPLDVVDGHDERSSRSQVAEGGYEAGRGRPFGQRALCLLPQ